MRWGEENTLNFVKLYLKKECLWNPAHEWYKNKSRRNIAYSEIIAEFKKITGKCMSIPEVKIKVKNLRSTYTQQVQKILKKSNPNTIYQPSLIWFHEMDQCLKYVPNSKPAAEFISSQNEEEMDSTLDDTAWSNQDKILEEEESSDPLIPLIYTGNEYDTPTSQNSIVDMNGELESSPEYSKIYLRRRKKKFKKSPQYFIKMQMQNCSNEDEFDIYGKYIASQLRKMELNIALKVQLQIQNLVNEARITSSDN